MADMCILHVVRVHCKLTKPRPLPRPPQVHLDATMNQLTDLPIGCANSWMHSLERLLLSRNNFSEISRNITELSHLSVLDLSHNNITTLPPVRLPYMYYPVRLPYMYMYITTLPPVRLPYMYMYITALPPVRLPYMYMYITALPPVRLPYMWLASLTHHPSSQGWAPECPLGSILYVYLSFCLVWCLGCDYLSFFPLCTFLASVPCRCITMYNVGSVSEGWSPPYHLEIPNSCLGRENPKTYNGVMDHVSQSSCVLLLSLLSPSPPPPSLSLRRRGGPSTG